MKRFGKTKFGILKRCRSPASWKDLIEEMGVSKATLYQHLQELQKEGFLAKHDGKYLTTELGEKQLNTLQKQREIERTEPLPISVKIREKLEKKIEKSLPQAVALMTEDPIKRVLRGFAIALTFGRKVPISKEETKKLQHLAECILEGTKLEMFPSPTGEERDKISEATLHFLSDIVKARNLRNEIAEKKKLIVMISLDLSDLDLDVKYIDNALYFAFT